MRGVGDHGREGCDGGLSILGGLGFFFEGAEAEFVDHLGNAGTDKADGGFFEIAFLPFHFDEGESGDEYGVVDRDKGLSFKGRLEDVGSLAFVVGEHALEEGGVERDDGLIAEQDGEEFE